MKIKWLMLGMALSGMFLTHAVAGEPGHGNDEQVLFRETFDDDHAPEWQLMCMQFQVEDGRLEVVSAPRPGFQYGHWGHGRSAAAFVHIGDKSWKDYRLEMDVYGGAVGAFNPHGIESCMRGSFTVLFRVEDFKESWNDPGRTAYGIGVNPIPKLCEGKAAPDSSLSRSNNDYVAKAQGWCGGIARNYFIAENGLSDAVTEDVEALWSELVSKEYLDKDGRILDRIASVDGPMSMGLSPQYQQDQPVIYQILKENYCKKPGGSKELQKIDGNVWRIDEPNHLVIEVRGRDISAQINGFQALKYRDDDPAALLYGGVGVHWEWDNTGWIDNVVVTKL